MASYTVVIGYDSGNVVYTVDVPRDNGSDFTSADWGEDNAEFYPFQSNLNNPLFALQSATSTSGDPASYQNHCYGRYAEFTAYLLDPFTAGVANNSPQIDSVTLFFERDADSDTYPEVPFTGSNITDCLDTDNKTFPDSAENERSTDCMTDQDGDGYGSKIKPIGSSGAWVSGIDCNDNSPGSTFTTWYADCDGDGFGDVGHSIIGCDSPPSTNTGVCTGGTDPLAYVNNPSDCNDSDVATYPGAAQIESASQCMKDQDNDGYGNSNASVGVTDGTDCNDNNSNIYSGAGEICDAVDNDCNLLVDDADPNVQGQSTWCSDSGGDLFGTANTTQLACNMPTDFVANCTDCDDNTSAVYPGATEVCDNIDNDCNNLIDDDDANVVDQILWCTDDDEDTFGTSDITQLTCFTPNGFVFDCTDCDDSNMNIHSNCEVPIFKNGFE